MRKFSLTLLITVVVLIAAACSDDEGAPTTTEAAPTTTEAAPTTTEAIPTTTEVLKVAILLPSNKNDLAWNQEAFEGVQALATQDNIEFAYTEQVGFSAEEAARFARLYAEEGFDLVIGHNSGFKDGIFQVAAEFPDVQFVYQDDGSVENGSNVAGYNMELYQAAYLGGIAAGGLTESGSIGGVGGMSIPFCFAMFNAFLDGARQVNPEIELSSVYVGDWADIAGAKASTEALADRGADVFVACGDGPARGVIAAVAERDLLAFGYLHPMDVLAPFNVVGSLVWDAENSYRIIVEDILNGTFTPTQHYSFAMDVALVGLDLNENIPLPTEVQELLDQALSDAASGDLTIPFNGDEI